MRSSRQTSSQLEKKQDEIKRQVRHEYLQTTQIQQVLPVALQSLLGLRPLPYNPYPKLVSELSRFVYKLQRDKFEVADKALVSGPDPTTGVCHVRTPDVPSPLVYGLQHILPYVNAHRVNAIRSQLAEEVFDTSQITEGEYNLKKITSMQGLSCLIGSSLRWPQILQIAHDIFVEGPQFEKAVTLFARRLLDQIITLHRSRHYFDEIRIIGENDKIQIWKHKDIQANRPTYFRAIKGAVVSQRRIEMGVVFFLHWTNGSNWFVDESRTSSEGQNTRNPLFSKSWQGNCVLVKANFECKFHYRRNKGKKSEGSNDELYKSYETERASSIINGIFFSETDAKFVASCISKELLPEVPDLLDLKSKTLKEKIRSCAHESAYIDELKTLMHLALLETNDDIVSELAKVFATTFSHYEEFLSDLEAVLVLSKFDPNDDQTRGTDLMIHIQQAVNSHLSRTVLRIGQLIATSTSFEYRGLASLISTYLISLQESDGTYAVALNRIIVLEDLVRCFQNLQASTCKLVYLDVRTVQDRVETILRESEIHRPDRLERYRNKREELAISVTFGTHQSNDPLTKQRILSRYLIDSQLDIQLKYVFAKLLHGAMVPNPFVPITMHFCQVAAKFGLPVYQRSSFLHPVITITDRGQLTSMPVSLSKFQLFGASPSMRLVNPDAHEYLSKALKPILPSIALIDAILPPSYQAEVSFSTTRKTALAGFLNSPSKLSLITALLGFHVDGTRLDVGLETFSAFVSSYIANLSGRNLMIHGVHTGHRFWTLAQISRGDEFTAAISHACQSRNRIVLHIFLIPEHENENDLKYTQLELQLTCYVHNIDTDRYLSCGIMMQPIPYELVFYSLNHAEVWFRYNDSIASGPVSSASSQYKRSMAHHREGLIRCLHHGDHLNAFEHATWLSCYEITLAHDSKDEDAKKDIKIWESILCDLANYRDSLVAELESTLGECSLLIDLIRCRSNHRETATYFNRSVFYSQLKKWISNVLELLADDRAVLLQTIGEQISKLLQPILNDFDKFASNKSTISPILDQSLGKVQSLLALHCVQLSHHFQKACRSIQAALESDPALSTASYEWSPQSSKERDKGSAASNRANCLACSMAR